MSVEFLWDEKKNRSNIAKHKISFDEAESVFSDDYVCVIFDPDH